MEGSIKTELSLIVPCYNESENIPHIIEALEALSAKMPGLEVILVDNGSTDNSEEVLAEILADKDKNLKIHRVVENRGYGYGILQGLSRAKGEVLSWTHADLQTDPLDVLRAYDLFMKKRPAMVKGFRKNRAFLEAFFSWGMQVLASIALGQKISEVNAQPKVFGRELYELVRDAAPHDFSLDLYFLYKAKRLGEVLEIPVTFHKRLHGEAKGGGSFKTRLKLINRTFKYIFQLRRKLKTGNKQERLEP